MTLPEINFVRPTFLQDDTVRKCNPVTNHSGRPGRRRMPVDYSGLTEPPTDTMLMLAQMKNEGHSWRSLAGEINERIDGKGVSHNLVRRVTLGQCKSPRIDYALGIRTAPPPIEVTPCPDCGKIHKQRKACKPSRKTGKRRLAFWLSDDDFDEVSAAADCHPGGRAAWLMENVRR